MFGLNACGASMVSGEIEAISAQLLLVVHVIESIDCAAASPRARQLWRAASIERTPQARSPASAASIQPEHPRTLLARSQIPAFKRYNASLLLTNAMCVPSGDHEGTLIVPCPP